MDKQSLAQLIEISCAVGTRVDYVQVGGGNTSVKSPDGLTMAIKASGTALTAMSESAGWVEVNIAAVLSIFERQVRHSHPSCSCQCPQLWARFEGLGGDHAGG